MFGKQIGKLAYLKGEAEIQYHQKLPLGPATHKQEATENPELLLHEV